MLTICVEVLTLHPESVELVRSNLNEVDEVYVALHWGLGRHVLQAFVPPRPRGGARAGCVLLGGRGVPIIGMCVLTATIFLRVAKSYPSLSGTSAAA